MDDSFIKKLLYDIGINIYYAFLCTRKLWFHNHLQGKKIMISFTSEAWTCIFESCTPSKMLFVNSKTMNHTNICLQHTKLKILNILTFMYVCIMF